MARSALYISIALHLVLVLVGLHWLKRAPDVEVVDIELAPAAPQVEALPAETASQVAQALPDQLAAADQAATDEAAASSEKPAAGEEGAGIAIDAGVDAPADAARRVDAAMDAAMLAGTGSNGSGTGSGSAGSNGGSNGSDALAAANGSDANAGSDAKGSNGSNVIAANGPDGSNAVAANGSAGTDGSNAVAANGSAGSNGSTAVAVNGSAGSGAAGSNAGPGPIVATGTGATGSGTSTVLGAGSAAGSGVAGAITTNAGSGIPGMDDQPAVDGAKMTAGTNANLLSSFPPGHTLAVLVRFDRLRGTEWAPAAESLFHPMPDYQSLFGAKSAGITDKLDMLVISTPRPQDATATTLVMQTHLSRVETRDLLDNPDTPIKWSAAKGGALGKRSGKVFPNDRRVILSPWKGWYVLAQPEDLAGATAAKPGSADAAEATKAGLPAWLDGIRAIKKESGDDKEGPALVMTVGEPPSATRPARTGRYKLPELGLGVHSLPVPQRISLAMELVKQGWLVRGNISFANEKDAAELATTLEDLKTRITDSHILSALLRKQHLLNVVTNLSLARAGTRISYATSISISDARAILVAASQALGSYFGQAGSLAPP